MPAPFRALPQRFARRPWAAQNKRMRGSSEAQTHRASPRSCHPVLIRRGPLMPAPFRALPQRFARRPWAAQNKRMRGSSEAQTHRASPRSCHPVLIRRGPLMPAPFRALPQRFARRPWAAQNKRMRGSSEAQTHRASPRSCHPVLTRRGPPMPAPFTAWLPPLAGSFLCKHTTHRGWVEGGWRRGGGGCPIPCGGLSTFHACVPPPCTSRSATCPALIFTGFVLPGSW